ncbi:MAG: inositol monophosphatase [Candidatus Woesearchaeota archaeon]|jgi:myo-inositol-1(or 4)-monophosphatase|nr:inositol monophosphatase [Candidatus Woesearchaeota archaeon]MDP7622948.1 inositol monophosphatase [Candidatus Woesearchaeota archaeon]HJN57383.1 inositol monophosphatase [Candidatus Woesearchaeota archaeon]|tara:strand:+ start:11793 stop:12542 length:750 start_codon:yes stop_codon:yes gene_type:complete
MKSTAIKAAREAGKVLMKNYGKIKFIKTKERNSFFTNVDLESEKKVFSIIRKKFPDHNIVSEESGSFDKKSEYTWYIDPLDGTHNYINNFPLFGVSVALAKNNIVKHGAIFLPYFNELYTAEKSKGAFLNGKRIKVSDKKNLEKSFVLTELALRRETEKLRILSKIKDIVFDARVFGCAVFSHAYIAKGSADIYITTKTNSWDIAAGFLLIEEANGKVTDFNNNPWKPKDGSYVASNKHLHNKILNALK